jgi:hypothetical protein
MVEMSRKMWQKLNNNVCYSISCNIYIYIYMLSKLCWCYRLQCLFADCTCALKYHVFYGCDISLKTHACTFLFSKLFNMTDKHSKNYINLFIFQNKKENFNMRWSLKKKKKHTFIFLILSCIILRIFVSKFMKTVFFLFLKFVWFISLFIFFYQYSIYDRFVLFAFFLYLLFLSMSYVLTYLNNKRLY